MKWKVSTDRETVELSEFELLDILFHKLLEDTKDTERKDFDNLTKAFADFMQARETLASTTIEQLICMSLTIGYFYRVFLEKNNVEKLGENVEELVNKINK